MQHVLQQASSAIVVAAERFCCFLVALAADAECIVSVIVLMVSRLEKDSNLAETASKLATSIGKQVRATQPLTLHRQCRAGAERGKSLDST